MSQPNVIVVGAGLAGLACARDLLAAKLKVLILERADQVGGRIRTDAYRGFLLDRGFQVFLTAYPEAERRLDYWRLDLRPFYSGALIWTQGRFRRLSDPFRHPRKALWDLLRPAVPYRELFQLARLRSAALQGDLEELLTRPEVSTGDYLKSRDVGARLRDRFLRPFFSGIFLEPDLATSSRMFEFVLRMMATGETSLPAKGMAEIPRQLAADLPDASVRLGTAVRSVKAGEVQLDSGETLRADAVVVATDWENADRLLPGEARPSCSASCIYFAAPRAPYDEPILALNGESVGPALHLAIPSNVSPHYAPKGQSLISITVLKTPGPEGDLEGQARDQVKEWFGSQVEDWRHLRTYSIERALPCQTLPEWGVSRQAVRVEPGVYRCGDYLENASINGALLSGGRAAAAVLEDRRQ